MTQFHAVKLELLRTGPSHNQLLSPLTPYIALCGNSWPITFQIRHEHHRFLSRLERLRYVMRQGQDTVTVPDRVREATVGEVGRDVADILAEIPSLLAELASARGAAATRPTDHTHFAHLNLVLGGSELALIPFELAFAPQAFPGESQELALQLTLPVVPTRQTRRSLPTFTTWDARQEPKLLVISAAPAGLDVPLAEHLHALRAAIEPWVGWPANAGISVKASDRLPQVKQRLRVLPGASLNQIRDLCARERYTHVHILAHGGSYELSGERQYGVVLCSDSDPARAEVVSGRRLAKALQAQSHDGHGRSSPFLVTLATCDSGNPGSVLVPGGGIAHDLHDEGIPWVIASQFPLTKAGSVVMTEMLYPGLLRGDDPRQVLHELRRQLYLSTQRNHDWASIVAYASVPREFESSIQTFFELQSRRAIDHGFARADNLVGLANTGDELETTLQQVRERLQLWLRRLPDGTDDPSRSSRAECYGMQGSAYKRMALICYRNNDLSRAQAMLRNALQQYRQAMKEWAVRSRFHWVAGQVLSLTAVLGDPPDPTGFDSTRHFVQSDLLDTTNSTEERAWAHGTMAELDMLSIHHKHANKPLQPAAEKKLVTQVRHHCRTIVELMGADSFHVESTRRQFQRYVDHWHGAWDAVALAAVDEFNRRKPAQPPR